MAHAWNNKPNLPICMITLAKVAHGLVHGRGFWSGKIFRLARLLPNLRKGCLSGQNSKAKNMLCQWDYAYILPLIAVAWEPLIEIAVAPLS